MLCRVRHTGKAGFTLTHEWGELAIAKSMRTLAKDPKNEFLVDGCSKFPGLNSFL